MAKPTAEFVTFENRLNALKAFIPVIPAGTSMTTTQLDSASAFVVLTHAACEEFMEKRVQKTADDAKAAFDTSGILGRVTKHLCVFPFVKPQRDDLSDMMRLIGAKGFGVSVTPTFGTASAGVIKTMVNKGHKEFSKAVRDNHGAGSTYQFKLLCAIGFDVGEFSPTFSSILGQLVNDRGAAAHTHVATAKTLHDPSDLAKWPAELIAGYKVMDTKLSALVKLKT